jgi:LPPG:FO 2-phospho-L-lactate transferase
VEIAHAGEQRGRATGTGVSVVVLAGGSGGAKLAAGMQDLVGEELAVIANTGDDTHALGVHVSPDPDLITYWLSDQIDEERGWGIRGDTFTVFERLVELGAPDWFRLSDRDLATCLRRTEMLLAGARLTDVQGQIARALGVRARVLPMTDHPVRTAEGWRELQEYLVRERSQPGIQEVVIEGAGEATPTPEVTEAIGSADAIVIGPSNPVISIGPILEMPRLREAISASPAPVVAVSPFVAGRVVKGPTVKFMQATGRKPSPAGVAAEYEGLIDGLVVDAADPEPPPAGTNALALPLLMADPASRRHVAERTLEFARSLA